MGLSRTGSFGSLILWPSTVKIPPQQRVNDDLTPLIRFHILLRLLIRIITIFTVVGILQVLHFAAIRRHKASATSFAPSCFLRRGGKGGKGGVLGPSAIKYRNPNIRCVAPYGGPKIIHKKIKM